MTTTRTDAEMIDLMAQAFAAVEDLCSTLPADAWSLPTDCPAWDVRDNLAHLTDFEARATGAPPAPDIDRAAFPHIVNDFQEATERGVQARRDRSGPAILEEFRAATAARLAQLRALDDAGWEGTVETPVGTLPQRGILPIRITDVAYHEQDIRRAAGRPGSLDGDVARFLVERMTERALPVIVGKTAAAPEGSVVRWTIDGPAGDDVTVAVRDGKGILVDAGEPEVTFTTDVETFLCLLGGRWTVERARTEGRLKVAGDAALAERILAAIVVVP